MGGKKQFIDCPNYTPKYNKMLCMMDNNTKGCYLVRLHQYLHVYNIHGYR